MYRRFLFLALFLAFLLALGLFAPQTRAEDTGFVAGDLPLMPGLSEVPGSGIIFDKPDGRIVDAYAEGKVGREALLRFYRDTLPQLGWRPAGTLAFERESEKLTLQISEEGPKLTVYFHVGPR